MCNAHLCLWRATFISNQQQIALSINYYLFLESPTCYTKQLITEEKRCESKTEKGFACGKKDI